MLFKNLILATLIAGQALASPLGITLDLCVDETKILRLEPEPFPSQKVALMLDAKSAEVESLTAGLLDLEGSDDMEKMIQGLRTFSRSLGRAAKDLPSEKFGEGETAYLLKPYAGMLETLVIFSEIVIYKNETIQALDADAKFVQRFGDSRTAWLGLYKVLQGTLYKCDDKEKKNGCEGQTPFNRGTTEVSKLMLRAIRTIRPSKGDSLLSEQLEL